VATIVGDARFLGLDGYWLLAFALLAAGAAIGFLLVCLRVQGAELRLIGVLEAGADTATLRQWLAGKGLVEGAEPFSKTEIGFLALSFLAAALVGWRGLPWQAESFLGHVVRGACWLGIAVVATASCFVAAAMVVEGAQKRIAGKVNASDDPRCREIAEEWSAARDREVGEKVATILTSDDGGARSRAAVELRAMQFRPFFEDATAAGIDRLRGALSDSDERRRARVARALGLVGDARARESLVGLLASRDVATGTEAARALARLGDPRGLETLLERVHFRGRALEQHPEIFGREKFWEPAESSGRSLVDVQDDAWDNVAALVNGLSSKDEDVASTAAAKLATVNARSALVPVLAPVLLNRLVHDHERLSGRTVLIVVTALAAMDPNLVAPRRELVPAIRKGAEHGLSAGVTTGLFSRVLEAYVAWAESHAAREDGLDRALREALERGDGASISILLQSMMAGALWETKAADLPDSGAGDGVGAPPASAAAADGAFSSEPRPGLAETCAGQILQFLRSSRTLEFEKQNDAWWSRNDLVAVLFKAGLHNDVPPEVFSDAAKRAIDDLVATKRIVGTDSGYRAGPA
jgi:hypothetical protein